MLFTHSVTYYITHSGVTYLFDLQHKNMTLYKSVIQFTVFFLLFGTKYFLVLFYYIPFPVCQASVYLCIVNNSSFHFFFYFLINSMIVKTTKKYMDAFSIRKKGLRVKCVRKVPMWTMPELCLWDILGLGTLKPLTERNI